MKFLLICLFILAVDAVLIKEGTSFEQGKSFSSDASSIYRPHAVPIAYVTNKKSIQPNGFPSSSFVSNNLGSSLVNIGNGKEPQVPVLGPQLGLGLITLGTTDAATFKQVPLKSFTEYPTANGRLNIDSGKEPTKPLGGHNKVTGMFSGFGLGSISYPYALGSDHKYSANFKLSPFNFPKHIGSNGAVVMRDNLNLNNLLSPKLVKGLTNLPDPAMKQYFGFGTSELSGKVLDSELKSESSHINLHKGNKLHSGQSHLFAPQGSSLGPTSIQNTRGLVINSSATVPKELHLTQPANAKPIYNYQLPSHVMSIPTAPVITNFSNPILSFINGYSSSDANLLQSATSGIGHFKLDSNSQFIPIQNLNLESGQTLKGFLISNSGHSTMNQPHVPRTNSGFNQMSNFPQISNVIKMPDNLNFKPVLVQSEPITVSQGTTTHQHWRSNEEPNSNRDSASLGTSGSRGTIKFSGQSGNAARGPVSFTPQSSGSSNMGQNHMGQNPKFSRGFMFSPSKSPGFSQNKQHGAGSTHLPGIGQKQSTSTATSYSNLVIGGGSTGFVTLTHH